MTFFYFPNLKDTNGQCFSTVDEIKVKLQGKLKAIPKQAFHQCYSNWKLHWLKCKISQEEYFEGNVINIEDWINTLEKIKNSFFLIEPRKLNNEFEKEIKTI